MDPWTAEQRRRRAFAENPEFDSEYLSREALRTFGLRFSWRTRGSPTEFRGLVSIPRVLLGWPVSLGFGGEPNGAHLLILDAGLDRTRFKLVVPYPNVYPSVTSAWHVLARGLLCFAWAVQQGAVDLT